jgi:hypothetical protein
LIHARAGRMNPALQACRKVAFSVAVARRRQVPLGDGSCHNCSELSRNRQGYDRLWRSPPRSVPSCIDANTHRVTILKCFAPHRCGPDVGRSTHQQHYRRSGRDSPQQSRTTDAATELLQQKELAASSAPLHQSAGDSSSYSETNLLWRSNTRI